MTLVHAAGLAALIYAAACAVPTLPPQPAIGITADYPVRVTQSRRVPELTSRRLPGRVNLHADGMMAVSGVPWFHQGADRTCAQANIAGVARYWGAPITYQQVVSEMNPGNWPTDVAAITRYLRRQGLVAQDYRLATTAFLEQEVAQGRPAVVLLDFGSLAAEHYVTVTGYHKGRRQFLLSDPIVGPNLAVDYATFVKRWQNDSLRVIPGIGSRYVGIVFRVQAPAIP